MTHRCAAFIAPSRNHFFFFQTRHFIWPTQFNPTLYTVNSTPTHHATRYRTHRTSTPHHPYYVSSLSLPFFLSPKSRTLKLYLCRGDVLAFTFYFYSYLFFVMSAWRVYTPISISSIRNDAFISLPLFFHLLRLPMFPSFPSPSLLAYCVVGWARGLVCLFVGLVCRLVERSVPSTSFLFSLFLFFVASFSHLISLFVWVFLLS